MKRLTTANPQPWPLALVVTIGVNSLGLISSEMPTPVSVMHINALLPFCEASIDSFPPFGMA